MVGAVHEEQGVGGGPGEQSGGEQLDTGDKFSRVERHVTGIGIAKSIGKMHDQHFRAIGCGPVKLAFMDLRADAAPEDGALDARTFKDLRHLRDMPKAVRHIADAHGVAKLGGAAQADLQIAHQGFAADEKFIGLHVPGSNGDTPALCIPLQPRLLFRAHFEVVIQDNGLPIEHEVAEVGVAIQYVE